jgi:hypothetical protein
MTARGASLLHTEPAPILGVRQVAREGNLMAILDACDAPGVPPKVGSLGESRGVSLYRGTSEERYADIAPYLVAVDDDLLDWILTTLWADPWGIFVHTTASLDELRTHLRKFLLVTGPNGEEWYFRFYDPRVLTKYLPTCTETELRDLFGPVTAYGVADPDAGVRWTRLATPQEAWRQQHPPKIAWRRPPERR